MNLNCSKLSLVLREICLTKEGFRPLSAASRDGEADLRCSRLSLGLMDNCGTRDGFLSGTNSWSGLGIFPDGNIFVNGEIFRDTLGDEEVDFFLPIHFITNIEVNRNQNIQYS